MSRSLVFSICGALWLAAGAAWGRPEGCNDSPDISIADAVPVAEGDTGTVTASFDVTISLGFCDTTIDFVTSDGSASTQDNDYLSATGSLVFAQGGSSVQTIDIEVVGDTFFEPDEDFFVDITISSGGGTIVDGQGRGVILNDDLPPALSIDDVTVTEGDAGTVDAVFTVSLSAIPADDVTVDFATADGSAIAGEDYLPVSGQLCFTPPNNARGGCSTSLQQTVTVPVLGDTKSEPDETFSVLLSNPDGADLADAEGVGTILDDDPLPQVFVADASVPEGDAGTTDALFEVSVSQLTQSVTVGYKTTSGTAKASDDDFVPVEGELVFTPGGPSVQVVAVPVIGDTRVENDETFRLDLVDIVGGQGVDVFGQGLIVNDDQAAGQVRILEAPGTAESAGVATVQVVREGPASGAAQVTVTASAGSATAGVDFEMVTQVLSWASGETGARAVAVAILDDSLPEDDETVLIALSSPLGVTLGAPSTATLTIFDDDVDPGALELVGEAEILARVGEGRELAVQVSSSAGTLVAGAAILWSVEGDATLANGEATQTDASGVSTQEVLFGPVPGIVVVSAVLQATGERVVFVITVEGDLRDLFDAGRSPGQLSVAGVLDTSCVGAGGEFEQLCEYVFGLGDADQAAVVEEATPREVAAQGTIALDVTQLFLRSVGSRLAALRGGATRGAVDQLALVIDGERVPIEMIAAAAIDPPSERSWAERAVQRALHAYDEDAVTAAAVADVETAPRLGFFASGRIAMGDRDPTDREEGFEVDVAGVVAGVDYRLGDDAVIGGAAGYLDTDSQLDRDGGGLDASGWSLIGYGSWFREAFWVEGALSWGRNAYDVERNVDLPVSFLGSNRFTARGDTDSDQLGASLGAGWERAFGAKSLETSGRLSWVDADIDGYRESGAGPFDLEIDAQSLESLLSEVALHLTWALSRDWGVLLPGVRGAWLHEFADDSRLVRGNFIADPLAQDFLVPTDAPDRDYFNLGLGVTAVTARGRSYYLLYERDLDRDDLEVGTFTFGLRLELGN